MYVCVGLGSSTATKIPASSWQVILFWYSTYYWYRHPLLLLLLLLVPGCSSEEGAMVWVVWCINFTQSKNKFTRFLINYLMIYK
jgi:hypothetical protein